MPFDFLVRTLRSAIISLICLPSLNGQGFLSPEEFLFWEDGKLIRVAESLAITVESPGKVESAGFLRLPKGEVANLQRWEGEWFVSTFYQDESGSIREFRQSKDGKTWKTLGRHHFQRHPKPEDPPFYKAYFLGGDRVLLKYGSRPPTIKGKSSQLVLGRIGAEGRLVPEEAVDLEIPGGGRLGLFSSGMADAPIPDGVAMIKERYGYIWTFFREGDGIKRRLIKLYPSLDPLIAKGENHVFPILQVQPTADGNLLVAARSEGAVLSPPPNDELLSSGIPPGASPQETLAALRKADDARVASGTSPHQIHLKAFPELFWFSVDPRSGEVRRVDPPGAPNKIPFGSAFKFSLSHTGWVRCPGALAEPVIVSPKAKVQATPKARKPKGS